MWKLFSFQSLCYSCFQNPKQEDWIFLWKTTDKWHWCSFVYLCTFILPNLIRNVNYKWKNKTKTKEVSRRERLFWAGSAGVTSDGLVLKCQVKSTVRNALKIGWVLFGFDVTLVFARFKKWIKFSFSGCPGLQRATENLFEKLFTILCWKTFHLSSQSCVHCLHTTSHRYHRSIVLGPTVIKMLPWHSGPQHLFILILFCQVMQIFGHESSVDDWWRTKCLSKKFELSRPLGPHLMT